MHAGTYTGTCQCFAQIGQPTQTLSLSIYTLIHMLLESGTSLGQHKIRKHLGTGGMGEVYLARDTKLNRDLAIKVLSSSREKSPELRRRFILEFTPPAAAARLPRRL